MSLQSTGVNPTDKRWQVKDGTLVSSQNRDVRLPEIWKVDSHPLCHDRQAAKIIWVVVIDTSDEGRRCRSAFQDTLKAPLGPDALMVKKGK